VASYYHFLDQYPYLKQEDMPLELEELASKLLKSGLLRIDGSEKRNFVRFKSSNLQVSRVFSKRELFDPRLIERTKKLISQIYYTTNKEPPSKKIINNELTKLKNEVKRHFPVTPALEKMVARLIVQMAESVIIELAILEEVEIFFSYSYMIGDVMDVQEWQINGKNSGMQSIANKNTQIFISSGGDPFLLKKEKKNKNLPPQDEIIYGDGKPALARAIIIGSQEFGHYADIIRSNQNYVSRHSGDLYLRYSDKNFNNKRLSDIKNIHELYKKIIKIGFKKFVTQEQAIQFYNKHGLRHLKHIFIRISFYIRRYFFLKQLISILPPLLSLRKYKYPLITTEQMFEDMLFNLEPKADVYKHSDKNIETAIACAEALARVPQQTKKWGEKICSSFYKELYIIYFKEVIPQKIIEYRQISQNKAYNNIENYTFKTKWQRNILTLKKFLIKKW